MYYCNPKKQNILRFVCFCNYFRIATAIQSLGKLPSCPEMSKNVRLPSHYSISQSVDFFFNCLHCYLFLFLYNNIKKVLIRYHYCFLRIFWNFLASSTIRFIIFFVCFAFDIYQFIISKLFHCCCDLALFTSRSIIIYISAF